MGYSARCKCKNGRDSYFAELQIPLGELNQEFFSTHSVVKLELEVLDLSLGIGQLDQR